MDLSLRENRVFRVHKFVHENAQRVSIIGISLSCRIALKIRMVKIGHISLLLQLVHQIRIHRNGIANFGYPVLNVDIFDMQHAETLDGRVLDVFERFEEGVEEELDLLFFEGD